MRYLRMLSNSIFGGALAATYVTLLMLHLNPRVPLTVGAVLPLAATLMVSYGVHVSALLYAASVFRQLVADPASPGWISLRMVTWSSALLAGLAATLSWINASGLRAALELSAYDALERTAIAFAVAAFVFFLLAVTHAGAGRSARPIVAAVFVLTTVASIALPLVWRGPGLDQSLPSHRLGPGDSADAPSSTPRVRLLLLEGASLDVIAPAVAGGRLPNFGRLLDAGALMHLATMRPTQPEPVWASAMTGKWPPKHRIRSSALYHPLAGGTALALLPDYCFAQALVRFGFFTQEPQRGTSLRAQTLWEILTSRGLDSGIIGLPLTHPAEPIRGFVVSDRFARSNEPAIELDERPAVYPPELLERARESLTIPTTPDAAASMSLLPIGNAGRSALVADRVYHDLVDRLPQAREVRLLAVRYAGLDAVGHYYLRYARPDAFGDVSDAEEEQFGRVLEDYYTYVDSLVGGAMATLSEDDVLLVISGFGMEPLTPWQRLAERVFGDPRFSGTHERAPEGFLFAYGSMVAPGRASRGALVDVTPTVLYFLGLPVARDMDGFVRTDLFNRPFNTQRTITFIPSYR